MHRVAFVGIFAVTLFSITVGPRASDISQNGDVTVYVTRTGTKYHLDSCRTLSRSKIPMKLSDAARSYGPCSICKPPVLQTGASPSARPGPLKAADDPIVYVTKTGSKYHRAGCRSLSKSAIPMKLSEASKRYGPCSICKPPIPKSATAVLQNDSSPPKRKAA